MDRLKVLWAAQEEQQCNLGLDPGGMSDVDRARCASDLELLLFEESAELARLSGAYKRHILKMPRFNRSNVADAVADVLKVTLALAQLHGLTIEDVVAGFDRKTAEIAAKAIGEQLQLQRGTRLICVDLDDVICDLSEWRDRLTNSKGKWINADWPEPDMLAAAEALKDEFYKQGRFREMSPVDGAVRALRNLKAEGFTIIIISARPQWQYKRLHADTLYWLDAHAIPHDLILFNKDKVEALHEHVAPAWPIAFVEDHERNIKALASVGVHVLVFDQPYNRHIEDSEYTTRVRGWAEVENIVKKCEEINRCPSLKSL